MSYYGKDENTEPAPGTGFKKLTGYELYKLRKEAKLKADGIKHRERFDADEDLKTHQLQESKKFK